MGKFVKVGKKEETREQENNTESKSVGRFVRVGNKSASDTQPKTIAGGSPMADGSPITTGRTVPANSFLAHRLAELEKQKAAPAPSQPVKSTPITTNDLIADAGNKAKRISEEDISSLMARQSELVRQGREMSDEYDDVSARLLAAQRQNREADRIDAEAKEAERAAQLEDGYRRASLYDLTVNAARRGFYGALEGQDSYYDMVGQPNQKERWDKVLAGDDFKYTPQNFAEEALEGAAQLLGQQAYTTFGPRAIASGLALAGTAALAGQAGPQAALPEEVITVPGAFATGLGVSSAMSNFEIEAGNAYNEMLEHGVSKRTASLVAQGVGGVNALLEAAQFDELVKAYQSIAGDHVTNPIKRTIWEAVQNYGYDLLNESLQESAQEGVTIAGTQLGSLIDTGDVAYSPEEIMDRELETFGSSVLSFGLMGAPALAGNVYNSRASRPVITREAATKGLIRAGADRETAENLAPIVASIVNGKEISGNEAGKIARSEAAIELVEAATGTTINTDAPISEVKNAIKELARPQESAAEAEPINNTPAEEAAQESEISARRAVEQPENGGTVEERPAIAEATSSANNVTGTNDGSKTEAPAAEAPKRTTKSEKRQKAREFVERFSDSFGKTGKTVFTDMYTDGQDAAQYAEDMMKAYNIGKKGLVTDEEWNNTVIVRTFRSGGATIPQLKAAYTAGKSDAESAKLISGEKNGLPFDVVVEKMPTGNTALANNANEGYTENSKNGLGRLVARLAKTDKAEVDGLFYTIKQKNDGFYTEMRRDDPDGYITNARASLWSGGPFATRAEAIDDLLGVARASVYKEKAAAERPESRPAPNLKQPDAWDSVVNDERISTMSEGEKEAVKEIFTAKGEEKEDNGNGNRADRREEGNLEEVSDDRGVRESATSGDETGGLLDGVPSEDVQPTESTGETGVTSERGGTADSGLRDRASDRGNADRRSERAGERGSIRTESGEVTAEAERQAEQDINEPPTTKADTVEKQIWQKEDLGNRDNSKGTDYVIPEKGARMPSTPKARFNANVEAIKTLRNIIAENRAATSQEQEALAKYTGWGGVSEAFDKNKADWAKEYRILEKLLGEKEYKEAKSSVLDAYYTEPSLIRSIYAGLEKIGFNGGRLLEPSAGVGRFIGAVPAALSQKINSWTAVELDTITGNIAKYLYPNADIRVQGFEQANIPDSYYDVAIGNVPFGNFGVADKKYPAAVTSQIHNYFIAKSLDKVRPGGVVAVITHKGTMDATATTAREYFMKQADLIGAIRLPNTAFKTTGTPVVADILIFKKRQPGTAYKGEKFTESNSQYNTNYHGAVNEYFIKHPDMVLGTPKMGGRYGSDITYDPLDSRYSLETQIERAFNKITEKMEYPATRTYEEIKREIREAAKNTKQGGVIRKDGKLYKNVGGEMQELTGISKADADQLGGILSLRDAARELLSLQINGSSEAQITEARKKLNKLYDEHIKKYGNLHSRKNIILADKDVDKPFIMALENFNKDTGKATKADLFTKNTVAAAQVISSVDNIEDGLTAVLNEVGFIDTARVAALVGESREKVEEDLIESGLAFKNRDGNLETAEKYLSGNVRAKLRDAEALAEGNPEYERNVRALREVIPADVAPEDINVRPGVTWIPDAVYSDFAGHMLGGASTTYKNGRRVPAVEVTYNKLLGKFIVEVNDSWLRNRPENTTDWGTPEYPFVGGQRSILDAALNNKTVSVFRKVGENRVLDVQATQAANEKLSKVLSEFKTWLWSDETRRNDLGKLYNDVMNNTVTPKYDGSKLTIIGQNPAMPMRQHQKDAVQRIINSGGNVLLAHRVGAGKTYEMASACMKLRQLGAVKKPVIIVPNHLVAQWGNEFLSYYPAAKILVVEKQNFTAKNRKEFANKIATGDYDAVIMSYEQFEAVPMSYDNQEAFFQEQIDSLEAAILENSRLNGKKDPSVRQMEQSKKALETRLKKLSEKAKKDTDNISFEELGIDALFVDEAHNFKNLFYSTKMNGVADLGDKEGSGRAFDLYMKTRYLQRLNGGRGIVFATATPVMNSVVELYTMQRYLQPDLLESRGLSNFDAWANQFGDVTSIRKMKPSGTGYDIKQSLSRYKNLQELQQMFRDFADVIVDADDLPYLKIPKMKGGKRIVVECDPSPFQIEFMKELDRRAQALRGAGKGKGEDHIFKIMGEGRMVSYSQKMIDPSLGYEIDGKVSKCADNVLRIYNEKKTFTTSDGKTEKNGTQLIFCDRGVPGGTDDERGASIYREIKNRLIAGGVPAEEIAFIHEADTEAKKSELFKKMNAGEVRVLIGSSQKMGTGMNVQRRLVALHELNAPDRPGDLEQNEGRALRQGNLNSEVEIYSYITKRTFDSPDWDRLKRKATFIHQIMAGEYEGREAAGDGDLAASAAEISAIASDNPLILEQFDVSEKINNLENLSRAHVKEVNEARERLKNTRAEIQKLQHDILKLETDAAKRVSTAGNTFKAVIGGKTFTDRTEAANAIIAEAKKYYDTSNEEKVTAIGSFAGFKLLITNKADLLLKGEMQYRGSVNMQSAQGTYQSLEALPKRIDVILENSRTKLSENISSISKLEKTANSKFEHEAELLALRTREGEINAALNPVREQDIVVDDEADDADYLIDSENTAAPVLQEVSSAGTSIKQIPALFKDKNVQFEKVNIDIGGGKYDLATEYLREQGVLNLVFDPYNRGEAQNTDTLNYLRGGHKADTATCANVLNVISESEARENVILEMAKAIKADGRAYFMVYEGDGTGIGKRTSAGWQNNRKTETYTGEIRKYFGSVVRKGKLIIATQPNSKLPNASWEVEPGKAIQYSRDDGLTDHPERWTTERIKSGGVEAPKPLSDIIAQISHDLGVHVTYGHVRGKGVRGQFSTKDKGVRSKIAQDLPVISHEIGHWLDDRYGLMNVRLSSELKSELEKALGDLKDQYPKKSWATEGFAEYIRQFLQNRETAAIEYPTLTEYILNALSAKELALFEQFADEINAYYALDADTATSSVKLREEAMPDFRTHEERLSDLGDAFKQAWTDSNNAIRRLDEETGGNAYVFATNAAYSDARAARILDSDLCDINGKYVGPGLRAALHGINTRDKTEWREFGEYLIVRHGPERLENGKRVFADDRKNNAAFMEKRRIELEDKYPEFKAAGDRVIQYEKALTQTWGVNTGLISQELFDSWGELYKNHVPLNRAVSSDKRTIGARRGFANQSNPIRRAKGSGLDIIHPVENIISETVILVNAGVRNDVMRRIVEQASKYEADAAIIEKVPTPLVRRSFDMTDVKASMKDRAAENVMQGAISLESANAIDDIVSGIDDVLYQYERGKAKDDVVTVLRNGKPEFWKINDRQLLESVTHLTTPKMSGILEAYAISTRFMTANITGNNPIWSIFSNAPRDLGTFMVYFKGNRAKALKAIASAYVNAFNEEHRKGNDVDPLYSEYLAMGGGHASAYSADINLAKKARESYTKTSAQTVLDTINPVNWVSFISDTIEMGPRFATYKIMRESGMNPHEAFYEAMDVTVNFRRGGVASRQVGKVVPFFNASVQGIDKFGRFFSAEDVKNADRAKVAGKRITMFLAASAALAALSYGVNNGDDEKEKEYQQLSNYTKNTYWCIPIGDGKYFCIPKPRELAVMTSLFETLLERTIGGNEHAFDEFVSYAADNFLPSVVSDFATYPENISKEGSSEAMKDLIAGTTGSLGLFGVFANMIANRDFLGKPIESQRERNTEPRDRYTQTTSKIAYWIGQALNWSPEMIDYFGNQVLGYLWKAPKALFPVGDENIDFTLGVKNTYLKDNAYSQDLVNWLYDRAEKSKLVHGSDKGNMDKAIANKNDSSMTTFYSRFNSLNKTVNDPNGRRQARQTVLDMINEYRKASDSGVTTAAQKLVYGVVRDMGETELMPSVLNTYIKVGETTYNLTDSQYVEYQTLYLNTYWSYAEQHLAGNHSKKEKIALLRQAKAVAKESATRTMLKRMRVEYSGFYDKFDGVSDKDIITFKAELDLADDDGSLKQDEVIDIVTTMVRDGLSYDDAYTLFHSKYDSDKNNPWA